MKLDQTYKIVEGIVSRNNSDGTIILMKMDDSDVFYKVDGVAAEIFKLITNEKDSVPLSSALEAMSKKYSVSTSRVSEDATPFLNELLRLSIIEANK